MATYDVVIAGGGDLCLWKAYAPALRGFGRISGALPATRQGVGARLWLYRNRLLYRGGNRGGEGRFPAAGRGAAGGGRRERVDRARRRQTTLPGPELGSVRRRHLHTGRRVRTPADSGPQRDL